VRLRVPALAVSLVTRVTAAADLSSAVTVTDGNAVEIAATRA